MARMQVQCDRALTSVFIDSRGGRGSWIR